MLARYLVERGSAPPRAGESLKGETGEASWSVRETGADGRLGDARVRLTTGNVRVLELPGGWSVRQVELDGRPFPWDPPRLAFLRSDEGWAESQAPVQRGEKDRTRSGPLKPAFDHGFVLVVPTAGTAEENAAALERARHDAEVWNGAPRALQNRTPTKAVSCALSRSDWIALRSSSSVVA